MEQRYIMAPCFCDDSDCGFHWKQDDTLQAIADAWNREGNEPKWTELRVLLDSLTQEDDGE